MNYNFSNLLDMRNLQQQVKKAFCYQQSLCQQLFWPFTVWVNCSSDLKIFVYSRPSASKFFSITRTFFSHSSSEQFLITKYHFFWSSIFWFDNIFFNWKNLMMINMLRSNVQGSVSNLYMYNVHDPNRLNIHSITKSGLKSNPLTIAF